MRKIYFIVLLVLMACISCQWHLKPSAEARDQVSVDRYDRIQSLYLTTGDFSALQQMNTGYPMQTRTLIEDVLQIGRVNDPEINTKFLKFYQDTVLQAIINEAEQQYANMDDINKGLTDAFKRLKENLPDIKVPHIYAQIGALDQSIVVGNNTLGIALDKYLGADYPLYLKYYPAYQRNLMTRDMIVPDCLAFYILSLYPMMHDNEKTQMECDMHMAKIQWLVNKVTGRRVFKNKYVSVVSCYMKHHKDISADALLKDNDYGKFKR